MVPSSAAESGSLTMSNKRRSPVIRGLFVSLCATGAALATLWLAVSWSRATVHAGQRNSPYGDRQGVLHASVIATGIPGAGAVAEVGDFLRGSPMHDNALFTPYAQPGKVLDPKRVLVASTSNFGAPLA